MPFKAKRGLFFMAKNLIIVESPAKVKTIKKFLGSNYDVEASGGHVRDLPKSKMGIDIRGDFEPEYITIRGKGETLANLKKKAKGAETVFLATDPDREGEAIAWHLKESLGIPDDTVKRISFNEITKNAVRDSLKNPRELDTDLVDAQQARRVLDRVVGYSISPLLWRKVKRNLSAGRVQSATLCMIAKCDEEIAAFKPEEYWSLDAMLLADKNKKPIAFRYAGRAKLRNEAQVNALMDQVRDEEFRIEEIRRTPKNKKAPLPFTTSTLQQVAAAAMGFSPQKTMRVAQQLYEGVQVKGSGTVALITYLRTDSTRISDEAETAVRDYIQSSYGAKYFGGKGGTARSGAKIQDAHEAIRPTDVTRAPSLIKDSLDRDQFRLYQLIWKRFVASRMADQKNETITVKVAAGGVPFSAFATRVLFDGFRMIYDVADEKEEKNAALEKLTEESKLTLEKLVPEQHFTQAPPHYTEATLVRAMEECGIGRPSTYAPTIATLLARHYVAKEGKSLLITELGEAVNAIMLSYFPEIADQGFTAEMEEKLDQVALGKEEWKAVMRDFYPPFEKELKKAEGELGRVKVADEESDVICERCGRRMVIKYGQHGKFLACPGFPECRNTKPFLEKAGVRCPKCGAEVLIKRTRKGRRYYGCERNPECDFMSWQKPSAKA